MKTHFKENDQVEVHDSTGPYYPATVICPFFKDKDSILVKYQTQTNFGGFQLREIMLVTKVRPTPPTELHRLFKVGDDVDAVIAKEWYRGTVMKILENSTYLVMVDCLADQQFMFDQCDLRVHREWVDGSWVPPFPEELKSQKETVRKKFEKGTLVEVSFNDEVGFEGAWFSGTIVDNKEKDKYRVEYKDLVDDGGKLLIDDVLASSIRPCPRLPPVVRFKCLQKVDAWYRDGWWEGSISKVLTGSKYGVYFSHHDEEIEFNHSHLRLHQDWLDGHWVTQVHD